MESRQVYTFCINLRHGVSHSSNQYIFATHNEDLQLSDISYPCIQLEISTTGACNRKVLNREQGKGTHAVFQSQRELEKAVFRPFCFYVSFEFPMFQILYKQIWLFLVLTVCFEQGCRQISKSWLPWDPVTLPKLKVLLSRVCQCTDLSSGTSSSPCASYRGWPLFWFVYAVTNTTCDMFCFVFSDCFNWTVLDSLSSPGCKKIICFLHIHSELHWQASL